MAHANFKDRAIAASIAKWLYRDYDVNSVSKLYTLLDNRARVEADIRLSALACRFDAFRDVDEGGSS